MSIPLTWLKEFLEIDLPPKELAAKLTEAGLEVEKWEERGGETVFLPEPAVNRPDWLSVYGVAREIAAVTNTRLKRQETRDRVGIKRKETGKADITIKNNFELCPRYTVLVIKSVKVKPSPEKIQKRLKEVGLRPINNLVDITNYVMWELGNPLHVFDYDKIRGHQMILDEAKGGEAFRSLDGIDYHLPKGAIIIKDLGRIIDLCGIKGGENSAVSHETENILLQVPIYSPARIRRTSIALGLRSDASAIFERGADAGNNINTLNRAAELVLEMAGGKVTSPVIDLKEKDFLPWKVELRHEKVETVLGISLKPEKVKDIFERLDLHTSYRTHESHVTYEINIPTFRNDLHIEEDVIEEVGRIYGYNNFPKTLPSGAVPVTSVAYAKNYDFEFRVKNILKGAGYSEIYTYSLVPEKQLLDLGINPEKVLRVDNPISREYEYLRPRLLPNAILALKQNLPNFSEVKLFELGKEYRGETIDKTSEPYSLTAILSGSRFLEAKGAVTLLLEELKVKYSITPPTKEDPSGWLHPGRAASIRTEGQQYLGFIGEIHPALLNRFGLKDRATAWVIKYDLLETLARKTEVYQPIPKYPPLKEDISVVLSGKTLVGEVMETIKQSSKLINKVELIDVHDQTRTFTITYLDPTKNLTDAEVAKMRGKILINLKNIKVKAK